jgi:hypothetical protein
MTSASTEPASRASTHPVVGDLDLTFLGMDLASDRGLQMLVFSAEPGSASHDRLQLLASWTETVSPGSAPVTTTAGGA